MRERWIEYGAALFTFLALAGLVVLSYGFNNWPLRVAGVALPLGHLLALAALGFAAWKRWRRLGWAWREPLFWALAGLFVLSLAHLAFDLPRYGGWAARDASFVAEMAFLGLGLLWADGARRQERFWRLWALIFLLNFAYSLIYPWRDALEALSPTGGVFRPVPLLGFYSNAGFVLLLGALFAFYRALEGRGTRRWLWFLFGLAQAGWSFVFQARSVYLGILLSILVVLLFLGWRKALALTASFALAFSAFLVLVTLLNHTGLSIQGRIGPITPEFYWRHLSSVWLALIPEAEEVPAQAEEVPAQAEEVPALGSARWRFTVWKQALKHWLATPGTVIWGEGFGQPLIDFVISGGVVVRQPHNTHLTILARLGLIGFVFWAWIQLRLLGWFWQTLKQIRAVPPRLLVVWLLLFYLNGMLLTSVQPWLEFSYGAIPFFTVMGFALGLMRQEVVLKREESDAHPAGA